MYATKSSRKIDYNISKQLLNESKDNNKNKALSLNSKEYYINDLYSDNLSFENNQLHLNNRDNDNEENNTENKNMLNKT